MNITDLTPQQLRQAADLQEKIEELQSELDKFLRGEGAIPVPIVPTATLKPTNGKKGKRTFSDERRARIAAAQSAPWAKKLGEEEEGYRRGDGGQRRDTLKPGFQYGAMLVPWCCAFPFFR